MASQENSELPLKSDAWLLYTVEGEVRTWPTPTNTSSIPSWASYSLAKALKVLQSSDENCSSDLILCLVRSAGSEQSLLQEFENFPPSLLSYLKSPGALSQGSSTVPEWSISNGLSFVQNYVRVLENSNGYSRRNGKRETLKEGETLYLLNSKELYSWPLAVWSGGQLMKDGSPAKVPIIMVFGNWSTEDAALVHGHYNSGTGERWGRLTATPEWIFHDLNSIFGNWHHILGLSALVLRSRSLEINDESFTGNVLQRMRRLNRAMATNILARECLLIQQNSIKEITSYGASRWINFENPEKDHAQTSFMERCIHVEKSIAHNLLIVHGILEQLQNLMSMIISIEQISSGQSVARLGYLGFVFLPLSFVAGIFGITTWSIGAKWYPVAALPCLVITITLAVSVPRITSWWESRSGKQVRPREQEPSPARVFNDSSLGEKADLDRGRSLTRETPSNYALPLGNGASRPGETSEENTPKFRAKSARSSIRYRERSGSWGRPRRLSEPTLEELLGLPIPQLHKRPVPLRIWSQVWGSWKRFIFASESAETS